MSQNDDLAYAMTIYKFLTLPLGVWPLQKYNTFSLVRSIICGFSITVMLITLLIEINFGSDDVYLKLDALMLIICNSLAVTKLLAFRLYADNLTRNYSSAVNDYLTIDTKEKRTIMRRHAFLGRMICYSILFFAYLGSITFIFTPMFAGDSENIQVNVTAKNKISELPVPVTFLGELCLPTSVYVVISTVQVFIMILTSTSNCGNDSLYFAITLHVCGQIKILKIEFLKYGMKSKNLNEDFSILVLRHRYLIKHAEYLADAISSVLLIQLLLSCIIISLVGFQLIWALKMNDAVIIIKTTSVLSALLLQLFFYSCVGDYLKCQTEEIANSIYSCNWYNLPTKLIRNVLFVIMRSQQPVQLLAGRCFVVNIKTYMTILKSSLSYLSVLRVMMNT
ncbi:odorant receptor 9a-like [Solenopsis invicta]|uniref:odorant receptor 9a-like n=1 Tax=Solenopsis invicta TaxID=13686 RepID=UPI00193DBDC0|nr:odorant receptor 9a-like [Solenopsis invicta]